MGAARRAGSWFGKGAGVKEAGRSCCGQGGISCRSSGLSLGQSTATCMLQGPHRARELCAEGQRAALGPAQPGRVQPELPLPTALRFPALHQPLGPSQPPPPCESFCPQVVSSSCTQQCSTAGAQLAPTKGTGCLGCPTHTAHRLLHVSSQRCRDDHDGDFESLCLTPWSCRGAGGKCWQGAGGLCLPPG